MHAVPHAGRHRDGPPKYDAMDFVSPIQNLRPWSASGPYKAVIKIWVLLVAYTIIWACVYHTWVWKAGAFQPMGQGMLTLLQITLTLLTTFRLQRAAVRFYESRAAMGKMVEQCRVTASKAMAYFPAQEGGPIACGRGGQGVENMLRWTIALPVATKDYLRGVSGPAEDLAGILAPGDAQLLRAAAHQPLYALHRMRLQLARLSSEAGVTQASGSGLNAVATSFLAVSESIDALTGAVGDNLCLHVYGGCIGVCVCVCVCACVRGEGRRTGTRSRMHLGLGEDNCTVMR